MKVRGERGGLRRSGREWNRESDSFLGKGDALFSRRVLTGEVPKADWKKLNRKATFKMTYKARPFKIQDVLAKMLGTFKTNLKDATDKEQEAQAQYKELSGSKREQLEEAQQALTKMDSRSRPLLNHLCKQVRRSSSGTEEGSSTVG